MYRKYVLTAALLLAALALLASCGNETATKPPAPALNLEYPTAKVFGFTWADVEGETSYKLLEDEDGSGSFGEIASIPADAASYELEVLLPAKLNARYKLAACNEAGCSESAEVAVAADRLAAMAGYLKASNTEAGDLFGWSVAISGDGKTLAVGAYGEDSNGNQSDNSFSSGGAVYVFVRDDGGWTQQSYIKASNISTGDAFGYTLALSADGGTLAVAAVWEDGGATGVNSESGDSAADSGAVYVFVRSGSGWVQQAYVKASNTSANDWFGLSLALSADGNTMAVGSPFEDSAASGVGGDQNDDSSLNSGAVYVFGRNGSSWSQQSYIKASNARMASSFGFALALSADGNTLAVGSPGESSGATGVDGDEDDRSASYSGAAYVFSRNDIGAWAQQAYIKASNTDANDAFGRSLAISGDGLTLVVGANREGSSATGVDGDQSDNSLTGSGAVYVFVGDGDDWEQQSYLKASNAGAEDEFGSWVTVSADGNTLAVGGRQEDGGSTGFNGNENDDSAADSGAVYLFRRSGNAWSQQAYIKATNTDAGDQFGAKMAISADGSTLVVGAAYEDSEATGVGGEQSDNSADYSGAVYVF